MATTSTTTSPTSGGDVLSEEPLWSISVKTVGAERQGSSASVRGEGGDNVIPSLFHVRVKPSDNVQSLHTHIENVTGLKESQQRLIYRGRLIQSHQTTTTTENSNDTNSNEGESATGEPTKISEIKGLADGHTIHLVRRQDTSSTEDSSSSPGGNGPSVANGSSSSNRNRSATETESNTNTESLGSSNSSSSSSATSSLLAALLGLGAMEEDSADENGGRSTSPPRSSWRRSRRNRNNYRLTAEDLEVPEPGSMESVRQGLMTLHTLLPIAESHQNSVANGTNSARNPLEHNRRWYLGQWIDCRDTVNQWLEATIVDMVRPGEILPSENTSNNTLSSPRSSINDDATVTPAMDPAVGASDYDGRRRLLLEPCESDDPEDLGGDLAGFRPRSTNQNVVLLLIHYNGWPHRWDEWIRSDSERIRPFRVRTRHPTSSPWMSPTTQSHYADSPPTHMGPGQSDTNDRSYLLNELLRVTTAVNALAQQAVDSLPPPNASFENAPSSSLPWIHASSPSASRGEEATDDANVVPSEVNNEQVAATETSTPPVTASNSNPTPDHGLEMLAPLMDRLGRTLVDAAPHIASLAAANRDADLAVASSLEEEETATEESTDASNSNNPNSLGGLLSMLNRERTRRSSRASQSQLTDQALSPMGGEGNSTAAVIDPDYMDFATGAVNISRGDVRSGPRSSRNGRDELSGLLGAYLAAASLGGLTNLSDGGEDTGSNSDVQGLGRLLRNQGSNGENGGIDIHIHAVVTAPGMTPGTGGGGAGGPGLALGLTGAGALGGTATTATTPPDLFVHTRRATAQRVRATMMEQNDDLGIFDELYSETPSPVSPSSSENSSNANNGSSSPPSASSALRQSGSSRRGSRRSSSNQNNNSGHRSSFLGRLFRRNGASE